MINVFCVELTVSSDGFYGACRFGKDYELPLVKLPQKLIFLDKISLFGVVFVNLITYVLDFTPVPK